MKASSIHHFLPEFYLKGFTNQDGQFKIFDVNTKKPKKNGKSFYPRSHFYIKNSNTVYFESGEDDFIEKLYTRIDNNSAKIITKIKEGNPENRFNVNEEVMPELNNFASQIFWRNPANENKLLDYINNHSLHQLGLKIISSDGTHNVELSEQFKNESEFYKIYRIYNSMLDSLRGFNCRTSYHIFRRPVILPSILSDNPIIFENIKNIKVYEDDYLLPLTKERLFVKKNLTEKFNNELYYIIDLIQIKQSKLYFAYTDIEYVEYLYQLDEIYSLSLQEYKKYIFENLI